MSAQKIRKHVYLSGRVQGVGFRAFTVRKAQKLNINGWVKNLADGRVEAVLAGKKNNIKKMLELIQQGPSFAEVDNIEVENEVYQDEYNGFDVLY